MKHTYWKLLAVLAILLVPLLAFPAGAEEAAVPTVYLDAAGGLDTNDGLSETAAVQSMNAAYTVLAEQIQDGTQGKIVLVSDYTFTFDSGVTNQKIAAAAHSYEVIITGKSTDVGFYVAASKASQSFLGLQGPTTFENITMKIADTSAYTNILICGNGGLFKIGEGVVTGTSNMLRLMAGPAATYTGDMSLEVNSGSWQDLCAGAYAYTMNGNGNLVMNGGSVVNLETTYNGKHNGDASITINGGTVTNLYGGCRNSKGVLTGDITVNLNGGTVSTKLDPDGVGTLNGTALLNLGGGELTIGTGIRIDVTGTATGTTALTVNGTPTFGTAYVTASGTAADDAILYTQGTCTVSGESTKSFTLTEAQSLDIALKYDDRKELTGLLGQVPVDVSISNEKVTSKKVGTEAADDHVIVYENGRLIAVGTGTATLTVNGTAHTVTVSPATISLFMITGHSVGAGDGGSISGSVLCEAGQVYSTHRPYSMTSAEGGLGYGAETRAGCKSSDGTDADISSQQHLDAFTAEGVGTTGEASALGYRWNQLTGEKVWVLNLAVGGSCLNEWQTGVKGHATWTEYHYDTAIKVFGYAQTVVKNEIAAGHYDFGHMAAFYHNGVNYANYPGWTYESIAGDYEAMWNGYKEALTTDMDGDGNTETLEGLGLLPFYNFLNEYDDHFDKPAGYYMAASAEYPDIFLASNIYFNWMKEEGLASFPDITYTTQGGATLNKPVSIAHSANGGTSTDSVFCKADNMHPTQVVHNAVGMNIADNLYAYLYGSHETEAVTLQDQAHNALTALNMVVGEKQMLVPMITPGVKGNVTFETSGVISLEYPLQIVANAVGTGTVTALADGKALAQITVTVTENSHVHCVCGGSDANHHSCEENVNWIAWGDDAYEQGVLPFLSGDYYLATDITVNKSMLVEPGETVRICLNGHTINTGTQRVVNNQGTLVITDCAENQGTLTSAYSSKYAQICYNYADALLEIYGGNLTPSGQAAWGGAILNHGTTTLYGGTVNGDTNVTTDGLEARGGAIYIISGQVNLYGGTVNGGYATKGGSIYMDSSTLVIDGGTVTGGQAALGGNIYADYLSNIQFKSGLIENGSSKNQGGNLYLYTSAKNSVARDCSLTISGGTVRNGTATDRGSNIFVTTGSNAAPGTWYISITGGQIIGGTDNVILRNNASLTLSGGTLTAESENIRFERSNATAPTPIALLKDGFVLDSQGTDLYMAENTDGVIRLLTDITEVFTVSGSPCLDLNGNDLSGLVIDGMLYAMDSTTDKYSDANIGKLTCTGNVAADWKTTGDIRRYIAIEGQDGSYSFHRIYVGITKLSLNPAVTGFGYKAEFYADATIQAMLESQGYSLWLDGGNAITRTTSSFANTLTLRLKNFDVENYGSVKVGAKVTMTLNNGLVIESDTESYSMQDMVELIDTNLDTLSDEQILAVKTMLEGYTAPSSWNIPNLQAWKQ